MNTDTQAKLTASSPVLLVKDVVAAANHYRDAMGFDYERFWGDPPGFVILILMLLSEDRLNWLCLPAFIFALNNDYMIKVKLFKDFDEDKRISMDLYADRIVSLLTRRYGKTFDCAIFKPELPIYCRLLPEQFNIKMRVARYLSYPLQVIRQGYAVNHIVDHGYAHLVNYLSPGKNIVTVHDMIPLLTWLGEIPGLNARHRPRLVEYSLKQLIKADKIIAVSNNTKNDLLKHAGLPSEKIEVVYNPVDKVFRQLDISKAQARRKLDLPVNAYLLLISGVGAYKNHETSLAVAKSLRARLDKPLFIVRFGRHSVEWQKLVRENDCEGLAIETGALSQDSVVELYHSVDCLLFPSLYEGFGWPPLEAMACGVPVVTSNVSSMPEVVGEAALMASPCDVKALSEHVFELLTNNTLRSKLVGNGFERVSNFHSEKFEEAMMAIYQSVTI